MRERGLLGRLLLVGTVSAGVGCTTINTEKNLESPGYYLGLIKYQVATDNNVQRSSVQTFGLRIKDGFTLGFIDERKVIVPKGCQVVVFVRTAEQLRQVAALTQTLKGVQVCEAQELD